MRRKRPNDIVTNLCEHGFTVSYCLTKDCGVIQSHEELVETKCQKLSWIFNKKRHKKGEHMSKESLIIALIRLRLYKQYPFGIPANLIVPRGIR